MSSGAKKGSDGDAREGRNGSADGSGLYGAFYSVAEGRGTARGGGGGGGGRQEVDWDRLDKTKFFMYSIAVFSSISACLFPLTVIKTKVMVGGKEGMETAKTHSTSGVSSNSNRSGLLGTYRVANEIVQKEGAAGLYKGFGTVVFGTIPARIVYLSTLEMMKQRISSVLKQFDLESQFSDVFVAGGKNLIAGGVASAMTQMIVVPIDVVSQKQMVAKAGNDAKLIHVVGNIIKKDGIVGLYRGFSISLLTFVPSSGIWWGSYGAYSNAMYSLYTNSTVIHGERRIGHEEGGGGIAVTPGVEAAIQTIAGTCAGGTSAFLTNPIDVVKTRLQVGKLASEIPSTSVDSKVATSTVTPQSSSISSSTNLTKPTIMSTIRELVKEEGIHGFMRGVVPRMMSTALWGTAMVTAYEFLKRASVKDSS